MFRAEHLLVTLNRLAARKPEAMRHLEDFLAQDLPTLAPLAIDVAIEQGDPLGRALANVLEQQADIDLEVELHRRIPARTTALLELAALTAARVLSACQSHPHASIGSIASNKFLLANRLLGTMQFESAVAELQQLTQHLEYLYESVPLQVEVNLARTLNSYAAVLHQLRRMDEAAVAARRANELYEKIEARSPGSQRAELATNLACLSAILADLGLLTESLTLARIALASREALADLNPDQLPDVASSLTAISEKLIDHLETQEATATAYRAVEIYEQLCDLNPDFYMHDLAYSLYVLGKALRASGKIREAIQASKRSVTLYHAFGARERHIFSLDLAIAEENLALCLQECGSIEEAIPHAESAVSGMRKFHVRHNWILPHMAGAISTLSMIHAATRRRQSALDLALESLDIRFRLVAAGEKVHTPVLCDSLHEVAVRLSVLGRDKEAFEFAERAMILAGQLSEEDRRRFLPRLALATYNLALLYSINQSVELGIILSLRAVELFEGLDKLAAGRYARDHARALLGSSRLLAAGNYRERAVEVLSVCHRMLDGLYLVDPTIWRFDLARATQDFSIRLADVGNLEESLKQAERAVTLRRDVLATNPQDSEFQQDLSAALSNLSMRLRDSGRYLESVETLKEAEKMTPRVVDSGPMSA
jgi:tetratricopeptide (TPR) repeat protein